MTHQMPTKEQIEALKTFAAINGRTWKSKLRQAWYDGSYGDYGIEQYGDTAALLQQVRNTFGPSWLVRFVIAKDGAWGVFSSADRVPVAQMACIAPISV